MCAKINVDEIKQSLDTNTSLAIGAMLCIYNCMRTVAQIFIEGYRLNIKRTVAIGTVRLVRLVRKFKQRAVPVPLQKMRTVKAYRTF